MDRRTLGLWAVTAVVCASGCGTKQLRQTRIEAAAHAGLAGRRVGTRHPLVLEGVASDGSWVTFCQARRDTDHNGRIKVSVGIHGNIWGDDLVPFLDVGGEELKIDAFVSGSADGHWVAVIRGDDLELIDSRTGATRTLDADAGDDRNPYGAHRAASFDADSKRMLYIKPPKRGAPRLAVRDLAAGTETTIGGPRGKLWRAWFDESGKHVWAWVVAKDTDDDGRLTLPVENTTLAPRRCRGAAAISGSYGWSGDEPQLMVARISAPTLSPAPGAVGLLGDLIVAVDDAGALEARGPSGTRQIADKTCMASILYADPETERLAWVCRSRATADQRGSVWVPLFFYDRGIVTDAGIEVAPSFDHRFDAQRRVWRARGDRPYDLATGALVEREPTMGIGDSETHRLHVPANGDPYVESLKTGTRTPIGVDILVPGDGTLPRVATSGEIVAAPVSSDRDVVIDLATAKVLGFVPGRAIAVSRDGSVLLGRRKRDLLKGPLTWHAPQPT